MTPRRFDLPADREAPLAVLRGLRGIDPTADLISLGEGQWLLGAWPDPSTLPDGGAARRGEAATIVADARRLAITPWPQLRLGLLGLHGATQIVLYTPGPGGPAVREWWGEPNSGIVEDFRERHWQWVQNRRGFTAAIDAVLMDERTHRARADALALEATRKRMDLRELEDIHRHAFRHPVSLVVNRQVAA